MSAYNNKQELLTLLASHRLLPKKHLGQNFLIDHSVLKTIVEKAELSDRDYVVEIGPGIGILTHELAKIAKHIDTIELDPQLIPYLKESFSEHPHINLLHADALKVPLPQKNYKLIANIPYYITSPLLNHFLSPQKPGELRPTLIILLVQKEVAEKICVREGDHSILSLQVQIFGKPTILRKISANCFYPSPKVDSALLKIEVYSKPLITHFDLFFKIIKMAFNQKRKTLLNSLQSGLQLPKENLSQLLKNTLGDEKRRPQSLNIAEWERLVENYKLFAGTAKNFGDKRMN